MNLSDSIPTTLSVQLLDTHQCRELSVHINEFENNIFGPDFSCDYEKIKPWVDSGRLFYAAVCGEAVAGRRNILSLASAFITHTLSRDQLLAGEIADYELAPWSEGVRAAQPAIYFSSVVSGDADQLAAIYDSLLDDLEHFLVVNGLKIRSGFCIASGPAGYRHLAKSGFCPLEGRKYLQKYDLMVIDAATARTEFWRRLLSLERTPPKSIDSSHIVSAQRPPELPPLDEGTSARDVEKRLALGKTERYRNRRDW